MEKLYGEFLDIIMVKDFNGFVVSFSFFWDFGDVKLGNMYWVLLEFVG